MIPSRSGVAHRPATWDDLAILPEGDRTEVVDGELWSAPSPLPRHGFVEGAMSGFVGVPFQYDPKGPGGWWIVPEIDVELTPHDIVRPDLSGWRRERMLRFPSERPVRIGGWSDGDVARMAPFDAIELHAGRLFPPEE